MILSELAAIFSILSSLGAFFSDSRPSYNPSEELTPDNCDNRLNDCAAVRRNAEFEKRRLAIESQKN